MQRPNNGSPREASSSPPPRRRGVAARVLATYALVTAAFALVAGWGMIAQREAAREAGLMRSGYLPLSLALRDLVASQDTWNTQLNHITDAKNPKDKLVWFETAVRLGRPRMFGEVRARISDAFVTSRESRARDVGLDLSRQTTQIEQYLGGDAERVRQLFEALDRRDGARAERLRDELVTRGSQGRRLLRSLEQDVERNVDQIIDEARARERLATRLLVALTCFMVLVGVLMGLYARRVLKPLAAVTERAKAVARGDLTPRPVVASNDEIGELAHTFEGMVDAIARANDQLLAAERLATIGKMAAHVTHEIRNPLSSIALNVELLEEDLRDDDDREKKTLLRAIKNEVERLTALSEQYLSVARRQPLRIEEEDIGELVTEACDFMRRDLERHAVTVRLDIEDLLPPLRVDEGQIKQALFNLIRNAREAMPGGGTIWVRVARASGGGVDVTIDDEGSGIDQKVLTRLFEPFFTTKGQGTGLGLAITQQIVEAHGGTITCEPRQPRGTRIWIHLPEREREREGTPDVEAAE
jgi:two-component system, NtrC family, sensor kinase